MTGKTVLVTGAAKRIGRAIALDLAENGYAVAIHYHHSAEDARGLAGDIVAEGGRATMVSGDLADPAVPERLIADAAAALGPVTALVNNASLFEPDDPATVTAEHWDLQLDVNLRAPVLLARHFAAALPSGKTGAIVNLIDQRVLKPTPMFFSYAVSKEALWSATRMLAQGLAPTIRVNAVAPGPTLPNVRQSMDDFHRQQDAVLLHRGPTVMEIAEATRFLLESPSVTGQMLVVDGGQHLAWETPDVVGIKE
ncbi:SDR family oxidoreductase [Microbaculum marinisediminis]|uniref:SDR family oxidoreductase n=1 Tax=Microbaculum marinisediminis TaxID=2931392 RepID=A0AAW5QZU8_9HYPH|nr:SDR family oxidoreductase [Microbaculum sp. A6E488]MCT8971971.1 SDR family oxidoreductase [Microbaculum sp. A6E488]